MPRPISRRPKRSVRSGTLRLGLIVLALLAVNIYFLGFRGGTSIGALIRTTRVRAAAGPTSGGDPLPAKKPVAKLAPLPEDPAGARIVDGALADGETIAHALTPLVGKKLAGSLEEALGAELDLAAVRAGQPFVLVYDSDDRLVAFEFRASPVLTHRLDVGARGITASRLEGRAESRVVELLLPAGPPLWDTLKRSGEPQALADRLAQVFAGEGDVTGAGATSGERLRVIVEKRMLGGRLQRVGRVLAAEWVTRAGVRRAFSFGGAYYTERGESVARRYLVSPLRPNRATAQARRVVRPLTETRIAIDYVAPAATIVSAVAEGTITAISRTAGGATVTLEVAPGERVVYTRLTRLQRAVTIGATVEQGRSLGRADAGLTLTYEGAAAQQGVGPAPAPRLPALAAVDRPRFGEQIAPLLERLRSLAIRNADPLASRALPAIP